MIEIIPTIHIYRGKCVHVKQDVQTGFEAYSDSPLEVAASLQDAGYSRIHLIDLEGAKGNAPLRIDTLKLITANTGLKVTFGGGIKNRESLKNALNAGADQVICTTIAATQPNVFAYWLECFGGETVIMEADVKEGALCVRGRKYTAEQSLEELLHLYMQEGLKYALVTDVARDGIAGEPAIEMYKALASRFPRLTLIAGGSTGSEEEIKELEDIGIKYVAVSGKEKFKNTANDEISTE